jgi:hypothetical protein
VRVEYARQRDVHEEALGLALFHGKRFVFEVAGHDAGVVRPVPTRRRRVGDELQPQTYGLRRRISLEAADQSERFASVAQKTLVHRSPPHAAGLCCVDRVEETALRLPSHEGQGCPPKRHVAWCTPRRAAVSAVDQSETLRRIVPCARDLLFGPAERVSVLAHRHHFIVWRVALP